MSLVAPPRPPRAARQQPTAERVPAEVPRRTDPDAVRAALGAPSRRAVVRTGVWSVPVVAAAMAAPAFAASPPVCGACSGTAVPQCIISGTGSGTCTCGPNLVCVGTGPLGLLNVCVGVGVAFNTCGTGTSTCAGVCLATGGGLIGALNNVGSALSLLFAANPTCTRTQSQVGFPTNICASPVTQNGVGGLGALCLVVSGTNLISGTLATAINTLKSVLNTAGLGPASSCASPYACRPGFALSASGGIICPIDGLSVNLGFCKC